MRIVLFANTDWYLFNFRYALIKALRDAGNEILLLSPAGPYGVRFGELGVRWEPVPMSRRSLNPFREMWLLWHLFRVFRRFRPDVVHGFTIKPAIYAALIRKVAGVRAGVSAVAGLGYVFTSNELLARALRPLVGILLRISLSGGNSILILQNSDDLREFRERALVRESSMVLIRGSGVNCKNFAPPRFERGNAGVFKVLLASRLLWDKGIREYVAASRLVRERGLKVEFLVAGVPDDGNPAAVPVALLRKWEEEGLIKWLGHVDRMNLLHRDVDAFVLPSYREGLPKSLIEAAASGLPLVTTDVPGCREVVSHEQDGLLVDAGDHVGLAGAIERLYRDPELRRTLGVRAAGKARECFDERRVIRETLAVYERLLSRDIGAR